MNSPRPVPLTAIDSATLAGAAYDSAARVLKLEFRSRATYCYFRVPFPIWKQLMTAESKGKYFNQNIRGRFPFQRLA